MPGKPGRGGQNRVSVEDHVVRGTFRRDRHGLPTTIGATALKVPQKSSEPAPRLPPGLARGLSAAGARFVRQVWTAYENWEPAKELLLRRCGEIVDAQNAIDGAASGKESRRWMALQRSLLATIRELGLED